MPHSGECHCPISTFTVKNQGNVTAPKAHLPGQKSGLTHSSWVMYITHDDAVVVLYMKHVMMRHFIVGSKNTFGCSHELKTDPILSRRGVHLMVNMFTSVCVLGRGERYY